MTAVAERPVFEGLRRADSWPTPPTGPMMVPIAPQAFKASGPALKVYCLIAHMHAADYHPSRRELAELMGFGKISTVDRYVQELENLGVMLTRHGGNGRRRNQYVLIGERV